MSNNTPGSSSSIERSNTDQARASGDLLEDVGNNQRILRRNLRKRRLPNASLNQEGDNSSVTSSASSIASQPLAVSHSKLRKVTAIQSVAGGSGRPDLQSTESEQSSATDPISSKSSPLPTSSDAPGSPFSDLSAGGSPNSTSSDGRVTRSRLRAMQSASSSSTTSTSASSAAKSFFAQGKDKIAKKGRNFLKKSDKDSKKKKDQGRSSTSMEVDEPNYAAASVIVRMNNNSTSSTGSGSSSSSSDTLEPTPGGSARTTPFELQPSAAATAAAALSASRGLGLRAFGFASHTIPGSSSGNTQTNSGLIMPRGSSRASAFLGSLVPRMQHLLGSSGGSSSSSGGSDHVHNCTVTMSNSRHAVILEGLRSTNDIRQAEAANELAELLLMGNEENLPNIPIREYVNQLNILMQKENNLELILTAVRCITNMQEALPRAMPILLETVPTLLQKLKHIECIDIAEQTLIALEVLSRRNAKSILHAGGFADAVMHVDFFPVPSQRLVYQIAANCASYIGVNDFGLIRSCLPDLTQKITFDDKRCCESICTFFYRLIEVFRNSSDRLREIAGTNFEFLHKIQQLLMIQPSTINSSTFVHLLKSVRFMCIRCSDIVGALIEMDFGRTLRFLLVGNEKDESQSIDVTLRPTQHTREIVALVGELFPPLPKIEIFEISSTITAYMNNQVPISGSLLMSREAPTGIVPVSVSWQYEDEAGDMIDFAAGDIAILEDKRMNGSLEVIMDIAGVACIIDLVEMKYSNTRTGFIGRIDRRTTSPDHDEASAERDADREKHNKRLHELIKMHFPILVEIGTATSCSNLRYEATRTMMRMIYSVESESELKSILNNLPLASYIFSTLSSNKGHAIIASALQLIHVLLDKLPRLYVPLFEAEGVFFMIQALLKKHKKEEKNNETEKKEDVKVINLRRGPIEVAPPGSTGSNSSQSSTEQMDMMDFGSQSNNSHLVANSLMSRVGSAGAQSMQIGQESSLQSRTPINAGISNQQMVPSYAALMRTAVSSGFGTGYPIVPGVVPLGLNTISSSELTQRHPTYVPIAYQNHLQLENLQINNIVGNLSQVSQDIAYVMQQQQMASAYAPNSASLKKVNTEKISEWIGKEAKFLLDSYHGKDGIYDLDKAMLLELSRISKLLNKTTDVGLKPLEDLAKLIMEKDISAFQLNHSKLTTSLCNYLVDNSDAREPTRNVRLKRFLKIFMNLDIDLRNRPMDIGGDMFAAFEKLVSKVVHAVGQLEQFQIKVTNVSGVLNSSSATTSSSTAGTVLRGSHALRFFQTHQIRCNLKRHPSCRQLKEWRHGRGSIKVDPFTSVSAIEKYLIDRGVGSNTTDSSSDNDDGSEDDPEVGSSENSEQPFTGKIEILIGNQPISSDLSILQAICQYSIPQDDDQEGIPNSVWNAAHTLYFRVAQRSETTYANSRIKSKLKSTTKKTKYYDKNSFYHTGTIPVRRNPLEPYLKSELEFPLNDPCADSCALLRVLYGLNRYWFEIYEEGNICPTTHDPILPVAVFHSSKLNAKVQRQLSDFLSVATQQIPKWTVNIVKSVPFMFPFDVRRNLLYCTSFGRERALMHLVTEGSDDHDNEATSRLIPRLERRKVTIKRNNLLADAVATFHQMQHSKAQLEVNFEGEIGTGFGPTLEFYSTISKEIQKHFLGLWSGISQKITMTEDGDIDELTYNENGLYPNCLSRNVKNNYNNSNKTDGRNKRFDFIGRLLAQALLDSRMLDVPFSPIFFKWLLHEEDTMGNADLHLIDPVLYNSIREIRNEEKEENLDSLELYFTMPGDESFELKKNGKNEKVKLSNAKTFADLVTYWRLVEGVREEMMSLRHGFEQVIDYSILKIFACEEMEQLFCGCTEGSSENDKIWSKSALQQAIRPDHGYTHESPQIVWLVDMLHEFSTQDRRKFLQFCTGSPRLPVGGFRGLHPPLTVVRKIASFGAWEGELPSAMTCYNFLKIPPYTSYEMFVERFKVALQFIYSFHLT